MIEHGRAHHNNLRNADDIVVTAKKTTEPLRRRSKGNEKKGTNPQLYVGKYKLRLSAKGKDPNRNMPTTDI